MSLLWPSKYAKIRFRLPAAELTTPPDPLVGWGGDTHPHTLPHSAPTHLRRSPYVPQKSSHIYAYDNLTMINKTKFLNDTDFIIRILCKYSY